MARVILAMSGGVDSSVAAWLLQQAGHEVIGLFMRTGVHAEAAPAKGKKGCCSSLDAADARRVADRLHIPFYALDFAADFDRVMDYFADEYVHGRTPNPCVMCNNWLKFGRLWQYGQELGADYVATGHYARILPGPSGLELHQAVDQIKDQSYVLFGVRRPLLDKLLLPIGSYTKPHIRDLARQANLPVYDKPDSVDICFVPEGDHAAFVRQRRPGWDRPGPIVDSEGHVLGEHEGIAGFTVGQRKGLGVAAGQRRYVLAILPESATLVVGTEEQGRHSGLRAERCHWLIDPPSEPLPVMAKISYRDAAVAATVLTAPAAATLPQPLHLDRHETLVCFREYQRGVAPGQTAVFYLGSRVLGGGWIREPWTMDAAPPAAATLDAWTQPSSNWQGTS